MADYVAEGSWPLVLLLDGFFHQYICHDKTSSKKFGYGALDCPSEQARGATKSLCEPPRQAELRSLQ
jgi:hypothetical protein